MGRISYEIVGVSDEDAVPRFREDFETPSLLASDRLDPNVRTIDIGHPVVRLMAVRLFQHEDYGDYGLRRVVLTVKDAPTGYDERS